MKETPNIQEVVPFITSSLEALGSVRPELITGLPAIMKPQPYKEYVHLITPDQICRTVWYVHKNFVRWYSIQGKKKVTEFISKPGSIILNDGFYAQTHSPVYLQAIKGGCMTWVVDYYDVHYYHELYPSTQYLANRLSSIQNIQKAAFQRNISQTDVLARYRYMEKYLGRNYFSTLTIEEVAPLINVSRGTLYRWLNKMWSLKKSLT